MKRIKGVFMQSRKSSLPNRLNRFIAVMVVLVLAISISTFSQASSDQAHGYWFEVQSLKATDLGLSGFSGLGYLPSANAFYSLDRSETNLAVFTMRGDLYSNNPLSLSVSDPLNLAYNPQSFGLYAFDEDSGLSEVRAGVNGNVPLLHQQQFEYNLSLETFNDPRGITFNSKNGDLYVLDAVGPNIIRVVPEADASFTLESETVVEGIDELYTPFFEKLTLEGLAYNPQDENYYVYSVNEEYVYAITESGSIESIRDVSDLSIDNFSGITFAPSSDGTDDPANMNLFIADSGSTLDDATVHELSINEPALQPGIEAANLPTTLINIIDGSIWNPPNPDSSGLEYLIAEGRLMISDSEVEEMNIYSGVNVFESSPSGSLIKTCDTTDFSVEPSGAAANPANGSRFFADDNQRRIFEVHVGPDGIYCTSDDFVTSISTNSFNDDDPEGVAYGNGRLFVTDGVGQEVNVIHWGNNGVFDGLPPAGDDTWTHFDTGSLGLRDPEGIGYHWERGTIFMISRLDDQIVETTITGTLLNTYEIGQYDIFSPAGVGIGPGSTDPSVMNVYISDRGVDNNQDPNENDGKVYEIYIGSGDPPPNPTNTPIGTATFTNTPTATVEGSYTLERRVAAGSDDAEECLADQGSYLTSSDLEFVFDYDGGGGSQCQGNQQVGIRFTNLTIPKGASITNAYIQFKVDETSSEATNLTIFGQASDNPGTFTTAAGNISSRPKTTASSPWTPPAWNSVGVAGVNQRTSNLAGIVQEIVGRSGWSSGNAMVFLYEGSGNRTAESYNGDIPGAPLLHVEYTIGAVNTPTATATATNTATATATNTATNTPTNTFTPLPPTATNTPTNTSTPLPPTATFTATNTPTNTTTPLPPTATFTATNTATPLPPTATFTATNTPTNTATATATFTATATNTPTATAIPTNTPTPTPPPPPNPIYISMKNPGPTTLGSLTGVSPEDIVYFDGTSWSMFFDGSDVGLTVQLDDFVIVDANTLLLTFFNDVNLPGIGLVGDNDIVQFTATSLGENSAGTFSLYFDGEDVGLDKNPENINAIELLPDGRLLISTAGRTSVPGIKGAQNEDILEFTPSSLGANTAGTWRLYFDGSDVGMRTVIDGLAVGANGDIYISTDSTSTINALVADNEDVFVCTPISLGENTECYLVPELYFDGSNWNLTDDDVDGIDIQ